MLRLLSLEWLCREGMWLPQFHSESTKNRAFHLVAFKNCPGVLDNDVQ